MVWLWFAIGAVAGSVANAVIYRLPRGLSWVRGRSVCPDCKHNLGFWDLIPVLSWVMLRGKCRYCHSPIPYRYLLVELLLGSAFTLSYLSNLGILSYFMIWITVVIAAMDWETMLVSDWLVGIWAILVILSHLGDLSNLSYLGGAMAGIGVIGGIWILSKKHAMGEGDIGIAAVMGLWLGWPRVAPALWISFVAGAVYGLWLLVVGRKTMKSKIAFGPFLILGSWIGYLWGDKIISYVFHF
ncbi:MAG: prepilin peptidase [Patescibacteria group bacterium]